MLLASLSLSCLLVSIASTQTIGAVSTRGEPTRSEPSCRFRDGKYYDRMVFEDLSCCYCYETLFRSINQIGEGRCDFNTSRIVHLYDRSVAGIRPDPNDPLALKDICAMIGTEKTDCNKWVSCCQSAIACCKEMSRVSESPATTILQGSMVESKVSTSTSCPASWDGFMCWNSSETDSHPSQTCPLYLFSITECIDEEVHFAERQCSPDGRWMTNMSALRESNYRRCSQAIDDCLQPLRKAENIIELVCESLSLLMVIPAILIFITLRTPVSQARIKIHLHLFIALALYDITHMIYETTVRHYETVDTVMANNSVECRLLNALTKFTTLSVFSWMLMEGFYLHWLMVNTFHQPNFLGLVFAGWGIPACFTTLYVIMKATDDHANAHCWFSHPDYDWVINGPLLACLALNLCFMFNIQRILTKLQVQQNEPSFYRRAVKALAILVPPFGLSLILTVYSPDGRTNMRARLIFECFSAALLHLQGFMVAIILCFSNGEVLNNIRRVLQRRWPGISIPLPEASLSTGMSHVSGRTFSIAEASRLDPSQELTSLVAKTDSNGNTAESV